VVFLQLRRPKIVIAAPLKNGGSNLPSFQWRQESRAGASPCAPYKTAFRGTRDFTPRNDKLTPRVTEELPAVCQTTVLRFGENL
jgi:hypothetical protein